MTNDPNKLERMWALQRELQAKAYGKDPITGISDPVERIQFIKDMHTAIGAELQEALDETGWKPWASSNHINGDAFKAELVDAWHFFMNLMLAVGMTPDELYDGYLAKRQKNIDRQQAGYDGVEGKCLNCKRALDDDAVHCVDTSQYYWCHETRTTYQKGK